jgi:transposase
VLEECGQQVLVANPRKTRLIYANRRKTDEIDAENLARLARLDPKLLHPLKHRGEETFFLQDSATGCLALPDVR